MLSVIADKFSFKEIERRYLNLKGIRSRRYSFKGPDVVQIDLTDKCNSRCLVCWLHSPLRQNYRQEDFSELDFPLLKTFIADLAKSGTKEIIFSGGGEPFFYPKIWEVLEFTQSNGILFRINTNFTLLEQNDIRRLLSFSRLASLTISVWATDPELYLKVHNRDARLLEKTKENIIFLNRLKSPGVKVKICAVINNLNYCCLNKITDFAVVTGCDFVEFTVTDVIPGITEKFLLEKEQLAVLGKNFLEILKSLKHKNTKLRITNQEFFLRRLFSSGAPYGEYDSFAEKIPCYAGWFFLRLRSNGDFNSCLKSHRIPIGNLASDSFSSVWNNLAQQEFRKKGASLPGNKAYFRYMGNADTGEIGCRRTCDNLVVNKHLYKWFRYLF